MLGTGTHEVFLYDRGGTNRIGTFPKFEEVRWSRQRDDISQAALIVEPNRCSEVLSAMHVGRHEIVVYRNGDRVWEGPITRATYKEGNVEVTAHDICHYLQRTIMRSGYDNRYSTIDSKVAAVTERMRVILINELARKESMTPSYNILANLDIRTSTDTARTSRMTFPYESTVWEEMDYMGARSGLDYTALGRRLLLFDVHDVIGRTPMLTDKDFQKELVVTSYGMELATHSAVTDGDGHWAAVGGNDAYYGEVELLNTLYGEGVSFADPDNPTAAELEALEVEMVSQAKRNLSGRYPTPTVVRVPNGTGLNPNAPVTIETLVPGVRIPVRATRLTIVAEQEQKLDTLEVTQNSRGERVEVTLSPAPGTSPWEDSSDTSPDTEEEDQ